MSTTTRLLPSAGLAFNEDVNKLRASVIMSQLRGGRGMLTSAGNAGGVSSPAQGFRTAPYSRVVDAPRTFLTRRSTSTPADVVVSSGAINNVIYAGGTLTSPADGDKVYIDATISGTTVTAVTVSKAASVPADTTTHVYTLLATVAVAAGVATPTPVAWNYSQMQICAGAGRWWGFGV